MALIFSQSQVPSWERILHTLHRKVASVQAQTTELFNTKFEENNKFPTKFQPKSKRNHLIDLSLYYSHIPPMHAGHGSILIDILFEARGKSYCTAQKSRCLYPSACSKTVTNRFRTRGVLAKEHSPIGFPVWFTFVAVTSQCIESAASMQAQFESFTIEEDGKDRRHGCHHPFQ